MSSFQKKYVDVLVLGAGAAGMMCAMEAAKRGRKVCILEKTNRAGKKILMSGGGRCNFTNLYATAENYISHNPHFCKSALSRYTPWDFLELVKKHRIDYYEKKLGQLFCKNKSSDIVEMLLAECIESGVQLELEQHIQDVEKKQLGFQVITQSTVWNCESLVIATGGLSIPTLGSSPFGYQLATQFGHHVYPTHAGLVPFTLHPHDKAKYQELSGISVEARVACQNQSFDENILFTHRGLSGPAILQISSYWNSEHEIQIQCLPHIKIKSLMSQWRQNSPDSHVKTLLCQLLPKKMVQTFWENHWIEKPIKQLSHQEEAHILNTLENWKIKPAGTEGYRTAEVTLGGVNCDEISSQSMVSKKIEGLYFIGEVLDVTGWLGGYNFQWAWASGWAAGQYV
jgi:predicted Rossmann fold flavoprotein